MGVGDMGSKEFYRAHRQYSEASRITELEGMDGVVRSIQAELESVCRGYYARLYSCVPKLEAQ